LEPPLAPDDLPVLIVTQPRMRRASETKKYEVRRFAVAPRFLLQSKIRFVALAHKF